VCVCGWVFVCLCVYVYVYVCFCVCVCVKNLIKKDMYNDIIHYTFIYYCLRN